MATERTARKEYHCDGCGQPIHKGERYVRAVLNNPTPAQQFELEECGRLPEWMPQWRPARLGNGAGGYAWPVMYHPKCKHLVYLSPQSRVRW